MARTLASVRLDPIATSKLVVFFQGLPVAYTNDITGAITGSGVGTWIGASETAIGGNEVLGTREVRTGLIVEGLEPTYALEDLKTGTLQSNPVTIRILDPELATLFAADKESEIVAERIPPSTTPLSTSIAVDGGLTTNPRGRHIGIEHIGPSGQRNFLPAIPFDGVGLDHPVGPNQTPVLVSDEPIAFAGRMVTIYRVYADPTAPSGDTDYTAYYTWDECQDAGDLVFVGIMRDAGVVGENEIYSIECHGWDALLRRTLGGVNSSNWVRIDADLTLSDTESLIAIGFAGKGQQVTDTFYDSSVFDALHVISGNDRPTVAAQIDGWISDALDGTDTNVNFSGGDFDTWAQVPSPGSLNPLAGLTSEGVFWIRRNPEDPATPSPSQGEYGEMFIVMHERAWRCLGYEPERQQLFLPPDGDVTKLEFRELDAGEQLIFPGGGATGINVPDSGYLLGIIRTIAPGCTRDDLDAYDNDGAAREVYPVQTSAVFVLSPSGGQVIRLSETFDYLEGQITNGVYNSSIIDGIQCEHSRWCVFRGDVAVIEDDQDTPEVEVSDAAKRRAVASVSWTEGTTHGEVGVGDAFQPAMFIDQWLDARPFGMNDKLLTKGWSGKLVGKGGIEIAPLNTYHYLLAENVEDAATLVQQILLSTGACSGWDDALDNGASIDAGPNTHPSAPLFAGDYELAELGLAIPYQLVAEPDAWTDAFAGTDGDLNKLRLAYLGPFQSVDVLESVLRPRGLCWSLNGKTIGAFRLGPVANEDADLTITEDDLAGDPLDPLSAAPMQTLRATGQLDGVVVGYRWDPESGKPALEFTAKSLDADARRRTGELIEEFRDDGAMPDFADSAVTGVDFQAARARFRQLWQHELADFFARRHYLLKFTLARPLGQDAMPGTSVAITNPWPIAPDGSRGIAGATGRIVSATHVLSTGNTRVQAIVFVGASTAHYAPELFVRGVSGSTVEVYPAGTFANPTLVGLEEPAWSSIGGDAQAGLFQRNGDAWTLVFSGTVASVNVAARTVTFSSSVSGWLRDKDHILVLLPYVDQDADSFPLELYGVIADYDNTIGDGDTPAPAFQ